MRLRLLGGLLLAVAIGALAAGPAGAGPAVSVSVRVGDPLAPVVVLTNTGTAPCRVATTSLGTVVLTRVEQAGTPVAPVLFDAAFDDGLDGFVAAGMRSLDPGASVELALPVVPLGPTGRALETVASSSSGASLGALFPVRPGQELALDVTYAAPVVADGPEPACPTAASVAEPGTTAGPASHRAGRSRWGLVAFGVAAALVALVFVGTLLGRRRRGGNGAPLATFLVVVAAVSTGLTAPRPASAEIVPDPSLADAWAECSATLHAPGGDPANILPTLEAPGVSVQLIPAVGESHEGANDPTEIWVFWDPDNRHRYFGTGGNADPCTTLYHELYHGFEDANGGQDLTECVTADGPSGLGVNEVNATRVQNKLLEHLGLETRSHYGSVPLPAGDCLPPGSQPTSDPECSGAGCADSNGDPHIATFDGARYDFQAVGELVAFRDPAGGFELQVRQEPVVGSRVASVNTAVAMDVGGDRVEIRLAGAGMELLVGGVGRSAASGPLPAGGSLELANGRSGPVLVVSWPDGSSVIARTIGRWGLLISAQPAAARGAAGTLEGLFGDFDGDPSDDIRPRGGRPVARPSFADLYPAFADSWRVAAASSLFTYPSGTGTDSFTDRTFPDREVGPADLPGLAAADALCRRRGVADPLALAACAYDVAITGQPDFVTSALRSQAYLDRAPATSNPPGAILPNGPEATASIPTPGAVALLAFNGTGGERVFVDVVSTDLPTECGALELRDADDRGIVSGCIVDGRGNIDGTVLPSSGRYSVVVDPRDDLTGDVRLRLYSTPDRSGPIAVGGEATATIAAPGAVARLDFTGTAGQAVAVDVVSATLAGGCGALTLVGPDKAVVTSGCIVNGGGDIAATVLTASGVWSIVLDPSDDQTGEVRLRLR